MDINQDHIFNLSLKQNNHTLTDKLIWNMNQQTT